MTTDEAYRELGLAAGAEKEAAAATYRALCLKHHPDRGGDPARMARITEAWATIRDAPAPSGSGPMPSTASPQPAPRPTAPTCRECGMPMYTAGGSSFLEPAVGALCVECGAGWGIWRLVSFFGPWLVLGLVVARFTGLPLNEASWMTYVIAAVPVGARLWGPVARLRSGSALARLSWVVRALLTIILGVVGTPFFVVDAATVAVQAIRAGGGRESAYLRRHAEQLVMHLEDGVRGWLQPLRLRR